MRDAWRSLVVISLMVVQCSERPAGPGPSDEDAAAEAIDETEMDAEADSTLDVEEEEELCVPALGCSCNPVVQCGCDADAWCAIPRTWSCSRVCEECISGSPGSKSEGEACAEIPIAECGPGLICARASTYGDLTCMRLCVSITDCHAGEICTNWIEIFPSDWYPGPCDYGTYITEYGYCIPAG